ncbi:MAG: hypothetical protein AB7I13_02435, partial [Vicinamibacterales bacterium]
MLDVFKSIAGTGLQPGRDLADALHQLIDRAQEERAALGALLQVATVRTAKLAPAHERLEQVIERVATLGGRVDDLAGRLTAVDERARELDGLNTRIAALTSAVDAAETAVR